MAVLASDAKAMPIKGVAFTLAFPIFDADGDLVTGAAGLDSEVSKDLGTFADCTNEATELATASGMYYLGLTASEMNADIVVIIVKTSTTGAKTTPIILYPADFGFDDLATAANLVTVATATAAAVWDVARSGHKTAGTFGQALQSFDGVAQAGTTTTITLAASAEATDNYYGGGGNPSMVVVIIGGAGAVESGIITGYVGSTRVATISGTWVPPDGTSRYVILGQ